MNKSEQDIEGAKFILGEIVRFASMEIHEHIAYIKEHKEDALCTIPNPFNEGSILVCGRESFRRFYQMTIRHIKTLKEEADDFDEEEFAQSLVKNFSNKFLRNRNEVNKSSLQSLLAATVKNCKANHKELTHYIPCVVVGEKNPSRFNFGVVEFIRMEVFLAENQKNFLDVKRKDFEQIRNHYQKLKEESSELEIPTDEEINRRANIIADELTQYFSEYNWVAKVTIPVCDAKVSRGRAEIVIDAALDILRLFFKELHGKELRMGHGYSVPEKIANLAVHESGDFDISYGWRGTKNNYVGNAWFDEITNPEVKPYLLMALSALDARISPKYKTHLKERLLDALSWYGQAISDNLPSTKIVKYVASWERLVVTKKEKDLTSTVTKRIALLAYDAYRKTYEETLREAKIVYEWRSNLMHGTSSPFATGIDEIVPIAERITQATLFLTIDFFVHLSRKNQDLNAAQLEKYIQLELEN